MKISDIKKHNKVRLRYLISKRKIFGVNWIKHTSKEKFLTLLLSWKDKSKSLVNLSQVKRVRFKRRSN